MSIYIQARLIAFEETVFPSVKFTFRLSLTDGSYHFGYLKLKVRTATERNLRRSVTPLADFIVPHFPGVDDQGRASHIFPVGALYSLYHAFLSDSPRTRWVTVSSLVFSKWETFKDALWPGGNYPTAVAEELANRAMPPPPPPSPIQFRSMRQDNSWGNSPFADYNRFYSQAAMRGQRESYYDLQGPPPYTPPADYRSLEERVMRSMADGQDAASLSLASLAERYARLPQPAPAPVVLPQPQPLPNPSS